MAMFVHLAPESSVGRIRRSGIGRIRKAGGACFVLKNRGVAG